MEESALTNQAIAELMLEIEGQKSTSVSHTQSERKVNPLGKANKRFLSRTINTVVRHNRREVERTQANCRQRLKDLDDMHERRKSNYFYSGNSCRSRSRSRSPSRSRSACRSRSFSRSRSPSRSRRRHRVKKSKKRRSRKRSSSRSSIGRSRSRSHRKKNKKKARKHKKSRHRSRRRRSSSSRDRNSSPIVAIPTAASQPTEVYLEHSKQMALAMAMVYGQVLKANSSKAAAKERESSPMSDIVKELMSDEEDPGEPLSISSNDIEDNVLTIDVSSNSESESDSSSESSDAGSETANSAGSCIALDESDNNNSDIEIIECPEDKEKKVPESVNEKQQVKDGTSALDSVDLTED